MDNAFCNSLKGGKTCPKRDSCMRYLWTLDEKNHGMWQSWTEASFIQKLSGVSCDLFVNSEYYDK